MQAFEFYREFVPDALVGEMARRDISVEIFFSYSGRITEGLGIEGKFSDHTIDRRKPNENGKAEEIPLKPLG